MLHVKLEAFTGARVLLSGITRASDTQDAVATLVPAPLKLTKTRLCANKNFNASVREGKVTRPINSVKPIVWNSIVLHILSNNNPDFER